MEMTPDKKAKAESFFIEKAVSGGKCQVCGNNGWNVENYIYELREFHGGDINLSKSNIYPLVAIGCTNCSNTILLSALEIGIVTPADFKAIK